MELKQSKRLLLLLFLFVFTYSYAQDEELILDPDSIDYTDNNEYFSEDRHYYPEEFSSFQNQNIDSNFDKAKWEELVKNKSYIEDSIKEKAKITKQQQSKSIKPREFGLQYIWIIAVLLILIFIIIKLVPYLNEKNIKNRTKLIINLENPSEDEIKAMDYDPALQDALKNGNYKLAYRLKYLSVLKKLIDKNLVLYRKEKTNYEYLLQLNGKSVYEPFRMLTFNFDGIWYGEMNINQTLYNSLEKHFIDFDKAIVEL